MTGTTGAILALAEERHEGGIFLTIRTVLLTNQTNRNRERCTDAFIDEIAENGDGKYAALPLMCDVGALTAGRYRSLGHMYDRKRNALDTTQIGSFVAFEVDDADGVKRLIGTIRVPLRHRKVCAALRELYESGNLHFSYEIEAGDYTVSNGEVLVDVSENNTLIGFTVVSNPACPDATAFLVASVREELMGEDDPLKPCKGCGAKGAELNDEGLCAKCEKVPKKLTAEQMFARTVLCAELDLEQMRSKFFAMLRKLCACNPGMGDHWNYEVRFLYPGYAILYQGCTGDYYRVDWEIAGEELVLSSFVPVTAEWVATAEVNFKKSKEETDMEELKARIAELEAAVREKETLIAERDGAINQLNEKIVAVGEQLTAAQSENTLLAGYKARFEEAEAQKEAAEKEKKCAALKEKAEKVLSAQELTLIAEAIEALDEAVVNKAMADKYVRLAEEQRGAGARVLTAGVITDSLAVEPDLVDKYITR